MKNRNPKSLWDELRSFMGWVDKDVDKDDDDEGEQAKDPALLFHLLFTVPLVITMLATTRRMLAP